MSKSLILKILAIAVIGLSQYGADAFGPKPKPGYKYVMKCSGMPRRCTYVKVPKKPEKPRTFCYTRGPTGEDSYKLTTCEVATKNCIRTDREMYHVKYHGTRKGDKVFLCEYVVPSRNLRSEGRKINEPSTKCDAGEAFSSCSAHCEGTCGNINPICTRDCRSGCKCVHGYVRDEETGYCIPPSYCPAQEPVPMLYRL